MRFVLAFLLLLPLPAAATFVEGLSCTKGKYRLQLPKSYAALRKMGQLKRERVLRTQDHGDHQSVLRELRFVGLELVVVTLSNKPGAYVVSRAVLSTPSWKIAGQFRVGSPAKAALRGLPVKFEPEIELEGDDDTVRLIFAGGKVQDVEYDCNID